MPSDSVLLQKRKIALALAETPGCVRRGEFTLRSGAKSDLYIDLRKVLTTDAGARLLSFYMLDRIDHDWKTVDTIGAPGVAGALLLGAMLQRAGLLARRHYGFVVREEAKAHGADDGRVVGYLRPGSNVVLVDDVLTSGGSLLDAAQVVRNARAQVVAAYVVVDRQEGGMAQLAGQDLPCHALLTREELLPYVREAPK